jgi:hypothetical protein
LSTEALAAGDQTSQTGQTAVVSGIVAKQLCNNLTINAMCPAKTVEPGQAGQTQSNHNIKLGQMCGLNSSLTSFASVLSFRARRANEGNEASLNFWIFLPS